MATIDIRIQRIDQLFYSLAPSPFHENERALRRDAENYIVELAGEHGRAEPFRLIVHAPMTIKPYAAELTRAIHAHFELAPMIDSSSHRDPGGVLAGNGCHGDDDPHEDRAYFRAMPRIIALRTAQS